MGESDAGSHTLHDPQGALVDLARVGLRGSTALDVCQQLSDVLQAALAADCVVVFRFDRAGASLEGLAGAGVAPTFVGEAAVGIGAGTISDRSFSRDEALAVADIEDDESFATSITARAYGCRSSAAVPIHVDERVWGVVEAHWRQPGAVGDECQRFLEHAATMSGDALARVESDNAQRRQLQAAMEDHQRFYLLVENATDIIGMSDLAGNVSYINPAGCKTLSIRRERAITLHVDEFLPPEERHRFWEEVLPEVQRTGLWTGELLLRNFSEERIHQTEATILLLEDPETGEPVGYSTIQRDVSERRSLEDQLRQSQKMEALGLLASGVAHDFNNHLTVIKGYTDMIVAALEPDHEWHARLSTVSQVATKAQRLADQLLTFSRRKRHRPRVVDLTELLPEMHGMLRSLIGEHIDLDFTAAGDGLHIEIDPADIEQLVLNLAVNARDAIEQIGTISITVRATDAEELGEGGVGGHLGPDAIVLEVADTGAGMTPEVRDRIFEPFFTTKAPEEGSGLGLATVYRIVSDAHADIRVDSEPGEGTRFRIFFPSAGRAPLVDEETAEEVGSLEGEEVVLVIEDDPDVLGFITDVLEGHGYGTIPCSDGAQALESLEMFADSVDAIICDFVLPHLSAEQLRRDLIDGHPGIPMVLVSGYSDLETFSQDELFADVPFLAKPVSSNQLLRSVRTVLDESQSGIASTGERD